MTAKKKKKKKKKIGRPRKYAIDDPRPARETGTLPGLTRWTVIISYKARMMIKDKAKREGVAQGQLIEKAVEAYKGKK